MGRVDLRRAASLHERRIAVCALRFDKQSPGSCFGDLPERDLDRHRASTATSRAWIPADGTSTMSSAQLAMPARGRLLSYRDRRRRPWTQTRNFKTAMKPEVEAAQAQLPESSEVS